METIQEIAKVVFILSVLSIGVAVMVVKVKAYQVSLAVCLATLSLGVSMEYGLQGFCIAAMVVGVVIPLVLALAIRVLLWLTWRSVRRQYVAEPAQPPVQYPTLTGMYRFMWSLEKTERNCT